MRNFFGGGSHAGCIPISQATYLRQGYGMQARLRQASADAQLWRNRSAGQARLAITVQCDFADRELERFKKCCSHRPACLAVARRRRVAGPLRRYNSQISRPPTGRWLQRLRLYLNHHSSDFPHDLLTMQSYGRGGRVGRGRGVEAIRGNLNLPTRVVQDELVVM
jgi:hypothetical protein